MGSGDLMHWVSFHTPAYKECASLLEKDFHERDIDLMSISFDDFPSWQEATRFKSCFLMACLMVIDDDVCWIDADARLRKEPSILMDPKLSDKYDLACVFFRDKELLSGTLWLARNPTTFKVIRRWICLNDDEVQARFMEQRNLQLALTEFPEARVLRLPPEYAFIYDLSRKFYGDVEPVIEHFQKSREIRRAERGRSVGGVAFPQS